MHIRRNNAKNTYLPLVTRRLISALLVYQSSKSRAMNNAIAACLTRAHEYKFQIISCCTAHQHHIVYLNCASFMQVWGHAAEGLMQTAIYKTGHGISPIETTYKYNRTKQEIYPSLNSDFHIIYVWPYQMFDEQCPWKHFTLFSSVSNT